MNTTLKRLCIAAIIFGGLVAAIYFHNSSSQRRLGKLVGIKTYFSVSDSDLEKAAKLKYPVNMAKEEALRKLEERGLNEWSHSEVKRYSSEQNDTEYLVVMPSNQQISLVIKEYILVIEFDKDSHRIKNSEISYGLTGF